MGFYCKESADTYVCVLKGICRCRKYLKRLLNILLCRHCVSNVEYFYIVNVCVLGIPATDRKVALHPEGTSQVWIDSFCHV